MPLTILSNLIKTAHKHRQHKEFPKVHAQYNWVEQLEGNGCGKRSSVSVSKLRQAKTLLIQFSREVPDITEKLVRLGEIAHSVLRDTSFPPSSISPIEFCNSPLSVAQLIVAMYIEEVCSLKGKSRVIKKIAKVQCSTSLSFDWICTSDSTLKKSSNAAFNYHLDVIEKVA